ncbi:hypothetical protein EI94DRAFT_726404 [Lactarius quietus]|nr:hypothetical protein EI94DRAFT_726404 [Lactarius quietus]
MRAAVVVWTGRLVPCGRFLRRALTRAQTRTSARPWSLHTGSASKRMTLFQVLVLSESELCEILTVRALLQGIVDEHLNCALSLQENQDPQQRSKKRARTNIGSLISTGTIPRYSRHGTPPRGDSASDMSLLRCSIYLPIHRRAYQKCGYAHDPSLRSFSESFRE